MEANSYELYSQWCSWLREGTNCFSQLLCDNENFLESQPLAFVLIVYPKRLTKIISLLFFDSLSYSTQPKYGRIRFEIQTKLTGN